MVKREPRAPQKDPRIVPDPIRKEYMLTKEQHALCHATAVYEDSGTLEPDNAARKEAWAKIGKEMGFNPDSVETHPESRLKFTAIPV